MSKATKSLEVIEASNARNPRISSAEVAPAAGGAISTFVFTEQEKALADRLGLDLECAPVVRLSAAVGRTNQALRLVVEAGLLFLSAKAELQHGEFGKHLEELGVGSRRAQECMVFARAAATMPDDVREALMRQPKSKALILANADIDVLQDLLDDPDGELSDLSVRDLRRRIRELEAKVTDTASERDAAQAERDGLAKQLRRRRAAQAEGEDGVPMVVADLRAETAALVKQAELALTALHPLGVEMVNLATLDDGVAWRQPTLRLALAGVVALRVQLDGLIGAFADALNDKTAALTSRPEALSFLQDDEVAAIAKEWVELTAQHRHEQALRAHEREQAKPRGKGRPSAPPKAPKGAA